MSSRVIALTVLLSLPALARPLEGVATSGKTDADFAPAGWKVRMTVAADLDGVAPPDLLVVLSGPAEVDAPQAIVWAHGVADGGYRLIDSNLGLLPCVGCAGIKGGDALPAVDVKKRVASFTVVAGSREVRETTHRFRFDTGTVRLIGRDSSLLDSVTGAKSSRSENLLTGAVVTDVQPAQVDDEGRAVSRKPTKKVEKRAPPKPTTLQAVESQE